MERRAAMLEVHRSDQSGRLRSTLIGGSALLCASAVVVTLAVALRLPERWRDLAAALGLACTVLGVVGTMVRMHAALREEAWLAVRTDGLLLSDAAGAFVAWDDMERIRYDERARTIVLLRRDAAPLSVRLNVGGAGAAALAARLEQFRRRAAFRLLR